MKARNDENLEGIQGLARGLGRLLPGGGARGEAIVELQARAEAAERARNNAEAKARDWHRRYDELWATLAAVRGWREGLWDEVHRPGGPRKEAMVFGGRKLDAILDGEGDSDG